MPFDIAAASAELSVDALDAEAREVLDELVRPHWEDRRHRYPHIVYSLMMGVFARIDVASTYLEGGPGPDGQTRRMLSFMMTYMGWDPEPAEVAIQQWRHVLMHTGQPHRRR